MSQYYRNQMTGKLGLYHVCCELSKLGWNVIPNSENTTANRIRCNNEDSSKTISIQVRSRRTQDYAISISNPNKIFGDFWVIALNTLLDSSKHHTPECYILSATEIANNLITETNEEGKISHFLDRKFNIEPFKENWKRIGTGFIS